MALFAMLSIVAGGIAMLVWSKPSAGPRVGIDAIRFDATGWNRFDVSLSRMMWKNVDGEILELKWVPEFSNNMADGDRAAMREESERLASARGGSLLSADQITVAGRKAGALIYKRDQGSASEYIGMLFIKNEADHFIFTVVSKGSESRVRGALESVERTIAFQ